MKRNELLDRPIAYHRAFAELTGSITAGLMLSQAYYWSLRTQDPNGWFWKTQEEWKAETCLSRKEQETARRALCSLYDQQGTPVWQEERRDLPAKLYFRINMDALWNLLQEESLTDKTAPNGRASMSVSGNLERLKVANRIASDERTDMPETRNLERSKAANKIAPNGQSFYTESTPETTSETTPLIDHGARTGQSGLGKTKAPERTAAVQAGQTLNVQPSVASPSLSPEVAALAQLLADVGIGVNAFTFEQYKDLADEYGMPAVIAGVHAAANQGKQQSFKYVSACIVNAAKGTGNDNRTANRPTTQTHSAQSPLPGAGREFERKPTRAPYDPRLEAVFNS